MFPSGSVLEIKIHTTWGDRHYVGLTGIELFSDTGSPVTINHVSFIYHYCLEFKVVIIYYLPSLGLQFVLNSSES